MSHRILTTHAGSLPRPDDLMELMWSRVNGDSVDAGTLEARFDSAVAEVVTKQRDAGVDIVSDGEYSKTGFHTYVVDRFSGFGGEPTTFVPADMQEFPTLVQRLFANPALAQSAFSACIGDVALTDTEAAGRDVARLKKALGSGETSSAFLGAISPGQITFAFPNRHYGSEEEYLGVVSKALAEEYRTITEAGLNLQIDSPDLAMGAHTKMVGDTESMPLDWKSHLPLAIEALNASLEGIDPKQVRLHVCWGNYPGPHNHDIPLADIIQEVLKANVGTLYIEGGNPRHEHEWRVFEDVALPDDKSVILGVIDVKTNYIEHPRVVADRLVRLGRIIGKERLIAGTDCGFDTLGGNAVVVPEVGWMKLKSLAEGAELASAEL